MPQFKPFFIGVPMEIQKDPEKFGLTEARLREVGFCNQAALDPTIITTLTDEQWDEYWETVKTIKKFEHELAFARMQERIKKGEIDERGKK